MIALRGVTVRQGRFVLGGITFEVPTGRYAVLMGRTGSGKTTLLEVVAGLRTATWGTVELNGVDVAAMSPGERKVGYVPQDRALFRTMTVAEHLAFGPRVRKWTDHQINDRSHELASRLGIGHLLERRPEKLSGGEAARVALGRAMAYRPRVLLLDEPLAGLDDDSRDEVIAVLKGVRDEGACTVLHITHSRAEADRLADVRLELRDGVVSEVTRA